MATIVTRATKGSALTWTEGDANITNLNTDKIELTDLSVSTDSASGGGSLSYSNTTGAFTFAPADVSSFLTDITGESINSLSDVDTTGITDGQVLVWDNANSKFIAGDGSSVSAIDDLSDVTITTPSAGQVLTYMESGQWENQDLASGATQLNDLSDVSYSGVGIQAGDYLVWTSGPGGDFFTNQAFSLGTKSIDELSDVDTTGITDGQILTWDNANSKFVASTLTTGLTDIVDDTTPQLGGNLDCQGNKIQNPILEDYAETIHSLGSTDTPTVTIANGNVQTVTISAGLALPVFADAAAGQSVTLLVSGSGTATGATGYKFAGGATTLTSYSVISIFYDGTTYWTSIATDFQ